MAPNGPQDARPVKFRFAYAQIPVMPSWALQCGPALQCPADHYIPAKQIHSRESESLSAGQNPQEPGRTPVLLPRGVCVLMMVN